MKNTIVIFFPFELKNIRTCYLRGDFESFDVKIQIFFVTTLYKTCQPKTSVYLFDTTEWDGNESRLKLTQNWIYVEITENKINLKELRIHGKCKNSDRYNVLWINYDFHVISQCEVYLLSPSEEHNKNYLQYLRRKIVRLNYDEKKAIPSRLNKTKNACIDFFTSGVLILANANWKQSTVTKYFNIALHIDNYLKGLVWVVKTARDKKKLNIKVMNLLLSVFLDMLLGILFLNWLNSKVSLDSFSTIFVLVIESVVNSIKDLIFWLRGDPAGLKLNWAFNKVLGTFFSFHIDIWWTFVTCLQPLIKLVLQVFLKLGLLGITFQASIISDLLALVSFHVYFIYAYAAKLYSVQISSIISLWRLFLGRKENPLRGKVDSCRYSPEQLFVGTLGFTILLFLLPTTLLYYSVFTSIRLSILVLQGVLKLIIHLNQTIPVCSTALWLLRSPKILAGMEIMHYNGPLKSEGLLLLTVKPVACTWWETISYFMPDCASKPPVTDISSVLNSIIIGKLIYPI